MSSYTSNQTAAFKPLSEQDFIDYQNESESAFDAPQQYSTLSYSHSNYHQRASTINYGGLPQTHYQDVSNSYINMPSYYN